MSLRFPYRGIKDTADACGDPLAQVCDVGTFRDRIWYVTESNPCPQQGWQLIDQEADCSAVPGDITDLDDQVVVGAVAVPGPAPLGAGCFIVGAYCGA